MNWPASVVMRNSTPFLVANASFSQRKPCCEDRSRKAWHNSMDSSMNDWIWISTQDANTDFSSAVLLHTDIRQYHHFSGWILTSAAVILWESIGRILWILQIKLHLVACTELYQIVIIFSLHTPFTVKELMILLKFGSFVTFSSIMPAPWPFGLHLTLDICHLQIKCHSLKIRRVLTSPLA